MRIPHQLQHWIDRWIYRLYVGGIVLGIAFVFVIIGVIYGSRPPHNFPIASVVEIPPNATVGEIADKLKQFEVIKSSLLFKIAIKLNNHFTTGSMGAVAGDYLFTLPDNVFSIAHRI